MERSWWIVLVLICNLAYGQINSGAIGNNRFLQRTNPQIDRAIADGGSSLDHPEIQRLARQMVDLGIWSNLVLWVHEGLVKERVSGSDVFVPTAYDISGNVNDAYETDTTKQPKLSTTGLIFNGGRLIINEESSLNSNFITISAYVKSTSNTSDRQRIVSASTGTTANDIKRSFELEHTNNRWQTQLRISGVFRGFTAGNTSLNTFYHAVTTYDGTNIKIYINGSIVGTSATFSGTLDNLGTFLEIGNMTNFGGRPFLGNISDVRVFNTALTATQIDAIFQETRGKYGI